MATIKTFEDIEAWKRARMLCDQVGKLISESELSKDYRLKDQINGSTGLLWTILPKASNETGEKNLFKFISFAKGSCGEARSQLYRILDRGYISKEKFEQLYTEVLTISRQISGLISYLKKTEYSGNKFKEPLELYSTLEPNLKPET
jgi:four helix bundle protein